MRVQTSPDSSTTRRPLRHAARPRAGTTEQNESRSAAAPAGLPFSVQWASSEEDVRQAQRLRYQIFAQEMGATLSTPPGTPAGIDADHFDPYCDHLLVRASGSGEHGRGPVIGTYRVLRPMAALRAGGLYTDTEFDLAPLQGLRSRAVELGRSCVHPGWRSGMVVLALWGALAEYMVCHGLDTMIGCASVSMRDGGATARQLWRQLGARHLVAPAWRVQPYHPLALETGAAAMGIDTVPALGAIASIGQAEIACPTPPLIKGYLRCGARLLGPPALDLAFNTADLPMMLRIGELAPRYRRHFLGS